MLKNLIKQNNHDFLHKYPWIDSNNKIKLIQSTIQTSNNKIIKEQKEILPLYYYLNLLTMQKPKIKLAKKSNASFKIRPNMIIGTTNHLHNNKLNYFYNRFLISILPLIKKYPKITYNSLDKNNYHILISYGWKNIISNERFLNLQGNGAHIQFLIKSPVKKLPFLYFKYN